MPLAISNINETFAYTPSSNSGSASNSSPQKTDNTRASETSASKDLAALNKYCFDPSVPLKGGTLRLVKNWDGSIQLKRRQWYQFWNFVGWGRDTGRAAAYVNSLLQEHNHVKTITAKANNNNIPEYLTNYLSLKSKAVSMEELRKKLDDLQEINPKLFSAIQDDINDSSNNGAGSETSQTSTQNASSPVSIPLSLSDSTLRTLLFKKLCRSVGITLQEEQENSLTNKSDDQPQPPKSINATQKTGKIIYEADNRPLHKLTYDATVFGSKEKYTITLEGKLDMKSIKGDYIPIFPTGKSNKIFFIVALNKKPPTQKNKSPRGSHNEYYYVSSKNTQSFVQKMQNDCPNATLAIAGWMEKPQISSAANTTE